MFQILIALAREVANGPNGMRFKVNFFAHAKKLGWIPKTCRTKKQGLVYLVDLAMQGFGYVPKGNVKDQYYAAIKPKMKKAS